MKETESGNAYFDKLPKTHKRQFEDARRAQTSIFNNV